MAPDPSPADGASNVSARRQSARGVSQGQQAAVEAILGRSNLAVQAAAAARLANITSPVELLMADMAKTRSALLKAAGAPGLDTAFGSFSRAMAGQILATQSSGAFRLAEALRLYDPMKPVFSDIAKLLEHNTSLRKAFADAAQIAAGPQSSYWLSLQTQNLIRQIDADTTASLRDSLAGLAKIGQLHAELTGPLAQLHTPQILDHSAQPVGHWRNYVLDLPAAPTADQVDAALVSGQTSLGMVAAEVAISPTPGHEDEGVALVEEQILDPWHRARQQVVEELYARLRMFDPTVPALLDGAWDDVERQGPAAIDKAATCMIEALDRTLRKAAPNEELEVWFPASGLSRNLWPDPKKQPPHALRIRYILQATKEEAKMAVGMAESLLTMNTVLRGKVQGIKHTGQGDITSVRSLLMSTEHLLRMLFLT